jgi:ketosteroid isomerase-like protein
VSQDHVELVRAMYDAFNRGDASGSLEYLHADAELHQAPEQPDTDSYYGIAEFQRGLGDWLSGWDEFTFEPQAIVDAEPFVVMQIRLRGRGRGSKLESAQEVFHVWDFKDGKAWRCHVYWTEAEARRAAGL